MKIRILFFFPYCPYPPTTGAHQRCMAIVSALLRLGYEVIFLGVENYRKRTWTPESVVSLKKAGVKEVYIYHVTLPDFFKNILIALYYRLFHDEFLPWNSRFYVPAGMRAWFAAIRSDVQPDIIWMNYVHWDSLIDRRGGRQTEMIVDYLDPVSLNGKMQYALKNCFTKKPFAVIHRDVLEEDFFTRKTFTIDDAELRIITGYDKIIAISRTEADIIEQSGKTKPVFFLPVTMPPVDCDNRYEQPPVFAAGPNLFNVQGYYYFTEKVLPAILKTIPDFSLTVSGSVTDLVQPRDGVTRIGFVDDIGKVYCESRFAICPVLGGTGQQIKIVEAMAHGLTVVATKFSAGSSPIIHGVNGFVAADASEFAGYCVRLWNDPGLCRKMGGEARKSIVENYSEEILLKQLSRILGTPQ